MAANGALAQTRFRCLHVDLERTPRGAILWVTLNRPQAHNSLSMELIAELHALLDALAHPSMLEELPPDFPRVVVLRAAGGRAFCAGVDIFAADRGLGGKQWDYHDLRSQQLLSRLIEKVRAIPQPVIAAMDGAAAGGGLALALAADCRLATRAASFSAAFVRLGLTGTDMGTSFFLPRAAGQGLAAEMLLTGRTVGAERAYQCGLVNEVCEDGAALEAGARRLAREMLALSPKGLQLTKEQLNSVAEGGSLRAALVAENSHQIFLVNDPKASKEAQEWLNTMLQAKKPRAKL